MLPLQLAVHNTTLSPEAEADIRDRAARLLVYYDRIMACRVTVDVPQRRRHDGTQYNVRIDLTVPGGELVIRRRPHEELRTAVQLSFHAARRRLQDYARRQRGAVKSHEPHPIARVSQFYPLAGYGFLEAPDGRVIYFDRNSVLDGGFDRLEVGTEVRFAEEEGEKGPQATSVLPLHARPLTEEV
jgi:cold shock CspA family protein/ribosome-associated translation inhibitor RaiA